MLTDRAVRAAAPRDKAYKLSDSNGLFLHVSPKNHKSWRFKFRYDGKEQLLTLGTYPVVSLADIRVVEPFLEAYALRGAQTVVEFTKIGRAHV